MHADEDKDLLTSSLALAALALLGNRRPGPGFDKALRPWAMAVRRSVDVPLQEERAVPLALVMDLNGVEPPVSRKTENIRINLRGVVDGFASYGLPLLGVLSGSPPAVAAGIVVFLNNVCKGRTLHLTNADGEVLLAVAAAEPGLATASSVEQWLQQNGGAFGTVTAARVEANLRRLHRLACLGSKGGNPEQFYLAERLVQ